MNLSEILKTGRISTDIKSIEDGHIIAVCRYYVNREDELPAVEEIGIAERLEGTSLSECYGEASDMAQRAVVFLLGINKREPPIGRPAEAVPPEPEKQETPVAETAPEEPEEEEAPAVSEQDTPPSGEVIQLPDNREPVQTTGDMDKYLNTVVTCLGKLHDCHNMTVGQILDKNPAVIVESLTRLPFRNKENEKDAMKAVYTEAVRRLSNAA